MQLGYALDGAAAAAASSASLSRRSSRAAARGVVSHTARAANLLPPNDCHDAVKGDLLADAFQRCAACHAPRVALSGSNHCSHSKARASRCWADSRTIATATTARPT